jgi:hypothetical protein
MRNTKQRSVKPIGLRPPTVHQPLSFPASYASYCRRRRRRRAPHTGYAPRGPGPHLAIPSRAPPGATTVLRATTTKTPTGSAAESASAIPRRRYTRDPDPRCRSCTPTPPSVPARVAAAAGKNSTRCKTARCSGAGLKFERQILKPVFHLM